MTKPSTILEKQIIIDKYNYYQINSYIFYYNPKEELFLFKADIYIYIFILIKVIENRMN